MGAGCRLWAVVGCGSRFGSFSRVHCRFREVIFDCGPLGSMWWWRGHWLWASCFVCGRGVVGVVVLVVLVLVLVLVEENKSSWSVGVDVVAARSLVVGVVFCLWLRCRCWLKTARDDHGLVPLNFAVCSTEFLSVRRNYIGLDTE
jgi:general stress protein CsbA